MALKTPIQPKTRAILEQLKTWCAAGVGRQTEAAREIGTDRYTVSKWFSGRQAPTAEQILSVREFLIRARRRRPSSLEPRSRQSPGDTKQRGDPPTLRQRGVRALKKAANALPDLL